MASKKAMDWMVALKEASKIKSSTIAWNTDPTSTKFESSAGNSASIDECTSHRTPSKSKPKVGEKQKLENAFSFYESRDIENSFSHYSMTDENVFPQHHNEEYLPLEHKKEIDQSNTRSEVTRGGVSFEEFMKEFICDKLSSNEGDAPNSRCLNEGSGSEKLERIKTSIPGFRETLEDLWELLNSRKSKKSKPNPPPTQEDTTSSKNASSFPPWQQKMDAEEEITSFSKGHKGENSQGSYPAEANEVLETQSYSGNALSETNGVGLTDSQDNTIGSVKLNHEVNGNEDFWQHLFCENNAFLLNETTLNNSQNSWSLDQMGSFGNQGNFPSASDFASAPALINMGDVFDEDFYSSLSAPQDLGFVNSALDNWVSPWDDDSCLQNEASTLAGENASMEYRTYTPLTEPSMSYRPEERSNLASRSLSVSSRSSTNSFSTERLGVDSVPPQIQVPQVTLNSPSSLSGDNSFIDSREVRTPDSKSSKRRFGEMEAKSVVSDLAEHLLFASKARSKAAASIRTSFQRSVSKDQCVSLLPFFDECI